MVQESLSTCERVAKLQMKKNKKIAVRFIGHLLLKIQIAF